MNTWDHKDEWRKRGKDFLITVTHHTNYYKENLWCVYAYIYSQHPHFARFEGAHIWQDAAVRLPLHRGPTFLKWYFDKQQKPISIQIGADYNHHGDHRYTKYATVNEAGSIFYDAQELFDWLEAASVVCAELEQAEK